MPDSATEAISDRATFVLSTFAADPRYGLDLMRPLDYSCYAGSSVFLSTPSDLVRFAMAIEGGKLLQPATVQGSRRLSDWLLGRRPATGWVGTSKPPRWQVSRRALVGHDGESLGGMVTSFMTFPEHGLVVAVTSNISYADTYRWR